MKTATKERPIRCRAHEVRAILDGRKTQTRRVVKPQPIESVRNPPVGAKVGGFYICPDWFPTDGNHGRVIVHCEAVGTYHCMGTKQFAEKHCPYGQPGDRLWVREAWRFLGVPVGSREAFEASWRKHNPKRIPLLDEDGKKIGTQDNPARWDANPWVWVVGFKRKGLPIHG